MQSPRESEKERAFIGKSFGRGAFARLIGEPERTRRVGGAEKWLAFSDAIENIFMQNNSSRILFLRKRHTSAQLTGIWQKTVDTWQDDLSAEDNWPIVVQ